ncbi:AAA family ATPase [Dolosigranulum pigrum]|uniref:AAA family ATPase n=1 Tax=Dolosigranulum pigrum TaxID=29394 RepID=UPI00244DD8CB|nr:AAA family ATPase [Dolosigranulum pigrum]
MFLKKIEVDNFRLLKDFEINLNTNLSMIIGKNNSGKTSVLFALEKILNSKSIVWEDINLDRQKEIYEEIKNINTAEVVNSQRIKAICLRLYMNTMIKIRIETSKNL